MSKKVIVIGSGFSSLSSACFLAKAGYDVTVLEKNDSPGGRARKFETQGFAFDMGPSWYWMPDVFDKFFASFGKKTSDYYNLVRLSPSYKVVFGKNDELLVPSDINEFYAMCENLEKGSAKKIEQFLKEAEYKYKVGINELVYKPSHSLLEFADLKLLNGIIKLDVFKSFSKHVRSFVSHPKLIELLEFPILFLGALPENTPALYSLMNYADIKLGTWYPMGGMFKIVEAMVSLATELGVKFKYKQNVIKIVSAGKKATGVQTETGAYFADIIVSGADYHHTDTKLLNGSRNYKDSYWEKRVMAPSSLIFYLGINKRLKNLLHHNLFFDKDFKIHANEIYANPQWPTNPLFYVSCPSVTDKTVAPENCENLFILIPVAPGIEDTETIREKYYEMVMDRLEEITEQKIRENVVYKKSYAHNNFISDYNAFKGNAYGLANTLKQTAILKPALKNKNLNNFFYTGQLTVPGPGVPPSLISGEVVANEIKKEFAL